MGCLAALAVFALILLLQGFLTLAATRWAAANSHCVASGLNPLLCSQKTRRGLKRYFSLSEIQVTDRVTRGIVHTEITARTFESFKLRARYDLEPSEYKRVGP